MAATILVVNAGSTGLKFGLYATVAADTPIPLYRGEFEDFQASPRFTVRNAQGLPVTQHAWREGSVIDHQQALQFVMTWLQREGGGHTVTGAGHRVLIGGPRFVAPVRVDGEVLDALDQLAAIDPSHQHVNVQGIRAFAAAYPHLPQVACFDTAFHQTLPALASLYALPEDLRALGVRHWGFHGLSYDYISRQLPVLLPQARRVIVAHLGGGASVCALRDGHSVETSMGFGALSGLPMATRCGDLPPEVLLYLLRTGRLDVASLETLLYQRAGLLGLSGISGDMRILQDSTAPTAVTAVAYFIQAVLKFCGAYVAVLGGLDALIFTAGIGEHSAPVRAGVCQGLAWLGLQLDTAANDRQGPRLTLADSPVAAWVVPTDEESMIARYTQALLR